MKCKELQVGDEVALINGIIATIIEVGENYAYAVLNGYETMDPLEFNDKDDQPEPIEITENILRQNKWEVQSYTLLQSEHYYVKDEGGNHLLLSHGTLSIWLAWGEANDGVFSDVTVPCKYVHQFQQVLRLVGLSEIADNFKV